MSLESHSFCGRHRMPKYLSVALFMVLAINLTANSYDSTITVRSDQNISMPTKVNIGHNKHLKLLVKEDNVSRSVRSQSPRGRESNTLLIQTPSGLRQVVLSKRAMVVEFPFGSYVVQLQVSTALEPINVTMNKWPTRLLNYTLGLGENLLDIGILHHDLRKYNSKISEMHYRVSLVRQDRALDYNMPHRELCYLEQDCDLPVYERKTCGLHATRPKGKHHQGFWKLNCSSCKKEESCVWSRAQWVEQGYLEPAKEFSDRTIRTCIQNHQMLFLGDSTNRVMMQSLMEKANTTLNHVVKSHDFIHYENVGSSTDFSFMYYPAFWHKDHPTFVQTLYSLTDKSYYSYKNGKKTILVVGGVQWLSKSQIIEINRFVRGKNIPPSNVYIKTHSSGFLVDVPGISFLHTKDSLKRVIKQNQELKELALSYGFKVIDTLKMTLSRYKEFLPGKCACHFHKVTRLEIKEPIGANRNSDNTTKSTIVTKLHKLGLVEEKSRTSYHISGNIHNAYTNMLVREMCGSLR